ncbi:MAG: transposase domain-containing protein [Hyphomicrobiales bacterium]|nr:transposase domain-containing protein [Hyphomicrobiales bacterium]
MAYTLNDTAEFNNVDPQAWLTDVLSRIVQVTKSIASTSCCPGIT